MRKTLGMTDYIKAAFNFGVPVPGVGDIPLNWLFMGLTGGLAFVAWPFGLIGGAVEITYLMTMASNKRFQSIVKSRMNYLKSCDKAEMISEMLYDLSKKEKEGLLYEKCIGFKQWCDDIIKLVKEMDERGMMGMAESYKESLSDLLMIYIKLSLMIYNIKKNMENAGDEELDTKVKSYEDIMSKISEDRIEERASLQNTMDIINKRLVMREGLRRKEEAARIELLRMDEQIRLIRDQVLMSDDPSSLSINLTTAISILDTHSEWMKENNMIMEMER